MNKSNSNIEKLLIVLFVILLLAVFAGICWGGKCEKITPEKSDTTNLILLVNPFDTILFNPDTKCAEWVKWKITVDRLKKDKGVERSDYPFTPDDTPLIQGQDRVTTQDYTGSGYDRGHLNPAADNKHSKIAMKDCMEMTNIIPQTPELNRGPWKTLEESCRKWSEGYKSTVYIVAGPVFSDSAEVRFIGRGIQVPDKCFKVILIYKPKIARGWIMNNSRDVRKDYQVYEVSVDSVEALTGYDFFDWLPDSIENKIESGYEKE